MESRRERICAWFTADGRGPASDAKNTWRRARSTQVKEEKAGQQRVGGGKKRDEKRRDRGGGWNSRVP
ncbi:hypothetical protein BDQ94DRAFT_144812 [Aspergillus welwitschiae]|uniref:Uncharacterized protein n=1 Tax=Aspergillus welwitschiae TaxID=1341132 RepID=A0A3F3Q0C6_9EURO|nr:hypothetical protein BDQ94DRAFT_144812 [Aspergillus welwitschiae]RDH32684.1 hypothetical protein BDQ94DRAFT_144812 [Aspergillus welwitschiae]